MAPYVNEISWPEHLIPFSLIDTKIQENPYEHYRWLRKHAPISRFAANGREEWIFTRHEDVIAILRQPKKFSSTHPANVVHATMNMMDAPDHPRLRQIIAPTFTPKAVAALEAGIRSKLRADFRDFLDRGGGDIAALGAKLASEAICRIVGLPIESAAQYVGWADDSSQILGRDTRGFPMSGEVAKTFEEGRQNLLSAMKHHVEKSRNGEDNVLRRLVSAWDDGEVTENEVKNFGALIFSGGHSTTRILVGNCFERLASEPSYLKVLASSPDKIGNFIEEMVRWKPSTSRLRRTVIEETSVGGENLPVGTHVRVILASANRDDTRFPNGEMFDPDRDTTGHVSFGHGVHACIGSWLARLEVKVLLETAVEFVDQIAVDPTSPSVPITGGTGDLVGLKSLSIKLKAKA